MGLLSTLFLVMAAIAFLAILAAHTYVGVYAYLFLYLANPTHNWWAWNLPSISYSFYFSALTLLFTLVYLKRLTFNSYRHFSEYKLVALLASLYIIASFYAVGRSIHLFHLEHYLKLVVIFFLTVLIISDWSKVKGFMITYVFGAMFIGLEAKNRGRDSFGRVEGIGPLDLPDSNGAGAVIVPAIIFCAFFVWRSNWRWKLVYCIALAFILNGLVLINSRGAFLGAAVGCCYMMYFLVISDLKFKFQKSYITVAILSVPILATVLVDDTFINRMQTITETKVDDYQTSGASRINYWLATFDLLEDYPFGAGIYGYQLLSPTLLSEELIAADVRKNNFRAVHSSWFQVVSEVGWFGLAVFVIIIYKALKKLRYCRRTLNERKDTNAYYNVVCIESALVSYLVVISFIDGGRTVPLYLLLALAFCAHAITQRHEEKNENKY